MQSIENIRHSLAHLLAMAVLKKYPKAKLGIGPTIEHGFYYDFKFPKPIEQSELKEFENEMRRLVKEKLDFSWEKTTPIKAKKMFASQPFKLDLIKDFVKEKKQLTLYHTGKFSDLCKGGHIDNTSEINPDAFALTKIAGAYWKGDEKNPQLTRIYGVAFSTKEELDNYLARQAEAERRDHRKLGPQLGLFTYSELVGQGLPLFTPKGALIRESLEQFVESVNKKYGYQKVWIPHLAKPDLYKTSGHWDKFKNDLFHVKGKTDEFILKPMNCPHHTQIYVSDPKSYKDLPIRFFETTTVYRDEKSGELGGLTRVRSITQDDGHVFLREDQIEQEFDIILSMTKEVLTKAGLSNYTIRLSVRDPKKKKAYLGNDAVWNKAEKAMEMILTKKQISFSKVEGEAAFYGPKMDLMIRDSLERLWQISTIQLDFNMPARFGLEYIDANGKKQIPVMIHRAFIGSIERFMGILIEHYAGDFPFWLAPTQVKILTISQKVAGYAHTVYEECKKAGIRAEMDTRYEMIGKKIREAELKKNPYIVVLGNRELQGRTVSVRQRGKKEIVSMSIASFIINLQQKNDH